MNGGMCYGDLRNTMKQQQENGGLGLLGLIRKRRKERERKLKGEGGDVSCDWVSEEGEAIWI